MLIVVSRAFISGEDRFAKLFATLETEKEYGAFSFHCNSLHRDSPPRGILGSFLNA